MKIKMTAKEIRGLCKAHSVVLNLFNHFDYKGDKVQVLPYDSETDKLSVWDETKKDGVNIPYKTAVTFDIPVQLLRKLLEESNAFGLIAQQIDFARESTQINNETDEN